MTRKDYVVIARVIRESGLGEQHRVWLARGLADALAEDNPRFKRGVFIKACVGEDHEHG